MTGLLCQFQPLQACIIPAGARKVELREVPDFLVRMMVDRQATTIWMFIKDVAPALIGGLEAISLEGGHELYGLLGLELPEGETFAGARSYLNQ